ncbi:MAG: sterol desaturase family protein [Patescibacteria group bacterium]
MTLVFMMLERLRPGRELPHVQGWYLRAILLNLCQLGVVYLAGITWNHWLQSRSLFHVVGLPDVIEGLVFWLFGTFVFYWWHRIRHRNWWWQMFHQVHHSPTRIETLTSFYKHPIEMAVNSILISLIVYGFFGGSIEAAAWYNVFAVFGEFFYHMNVCTPHWIGYFIQRPEHHSIHHQTGVHQYNFGDLTFWDRLFGTFKDVTRFVDHSGFEGGRETQLADMLAFKDINK